MKWLQELADAAKAAADEALSDKPRFSPGDGCTFCKAKAECPALRNHVVQLAFEEFSGEEVEVRPVSRLTGADIAEILPHVQLIQGWLKAVESKAISEIDAGREVPGYKLVEGRSQRQWGSEELVEKELLEVLELSGTPLDQAYTKKLLGPAGVEKLLGKKHPLLAEHVVKPAGKPTLVVESDKRPPLPPAADRDFDEPI